MAKKTDLAKAPAADLAIPEHLRNGKQRGMEKVDATDTLLSRVALLQPLSPEVVSGDKVAGTMVDSITGELLGDDGKEISFTAVTHYKSRIMFDGVGKEATMECSSLDGTKSTKGELCLSCEHAQWATDQKGNSVKPPCTIFYNFPIVILGGKTPVIMGLSMSRTKIKTAKKFLTLIRHAGPTMDMFGMKFKLIVVKETSNNKTYFNFDVVPDGYTSKEEFTFAEQFYNVLQKSTVKIETEADPATAEETADEAPKPAKTVGGKKRSI